MTLADLRERMERDFAAVRADLKRVEALLAKTPRGEKHASESSGRLRRALSLLRELQWRGTGRDRPRHCAVCRSAEPRHSADCELAAVLRD